MKASLKILAVLFSITLASIFIYVVATRDSMSAEEMRIQQQKERDQAQIAKYKAEIKTLEESEKQDVEIFLKLVNLKDKLNKLEGKPIAHNENQKFQFEEGTPLFSSSKSGFRLLSERDLKENSKKSDIRPSFSQASEDGPVLFGGSKTRVLKLSKGDLDKWEELVPKDNKKLEEQELKGFLRFLQSDSNPFKNLPKATPRSAPKPRLHSSKSLDTKSSVQLSDLEKLRKLFLENKSKEEPKKSN